MILQGVGKRDYWLNTAAIFPFGAYDQNERQFYPVYSNQTDYWTAKSYDPQSPDYMVPANPDAKLPRIYGQLENATSNMRVSDRYLQSASYMRIKNLQLLPPCIVARPHEDHQCTQGLCELREPRDLLVPSKGIRSRTTQLGLSILSYLLLRFEHHLLISGQ